MMKYGLIFLLIIIATFCYAEIYQQIDSHGNIIYSDKPLSDKANEVNLPEINVTNSSPVMPSISLPPAASAISTTSATSISTTVNDLNQSYQTFLIDSPKNEETIQNQATIPVEIKIEPALREGDKIQLLIDGNPSGPPLATTHFDLVNVDRGTHQLSAFVVGKNQTILNQSNVVTVYIHHASIFSIQSTKGQAATAAPAP